MTKISTSIQHSAIQLTSIRLIISSWQGYAKDKVRKPMGEYKFDYTEAIDRKAFTSKERKKEEKKEKKKERKKERKERKEGEESKRKKKRKRPRFRVQ